MTVMVVTVRNLTQDAVELLNVVMGTAMVMKPKHHVQKTVLVALLVVLNPVMTVNLIGLLTDLNAVIQHGMSMVLTAPHLKALMAGIVQAVLVLEITVALTAALMVESVTLVILMIAPEMVTAVQSLGLVMALLIVKTRLMAVI